MNNLSKAALYLWLASFSLIVDASDSAMEIIPLKHRPAELILPSLRAIASEDTRLTAAQNQLIIRAPAQEAAKLKLLVEELDQPLAQFRIHVRQKKRHSSSGEQLSANTQYQSGRSTITVGKKTLDGKVIPQSSSSHASTNGQYTSSVTVKSYSTSSNSGNTQQVRAIEGYSAHIETGEEVPFLTRTYDEGHRQYRQNYRPVITGFYVIPTLSGDDHVTLSLSATQQKLSDSNSKAIESSAYQSRIIAPLNQWIDLGASIESSNEGGRAIAKRHSVNSSDHYTIEVMIETEH